MPETALPETHRTKASRRERREAAKPGARTPAFVFRNFVPDGAGGWAEVTDAAGRRRLAARLALAARDLSLLPDAGAEI